MTIPVPTIEEEIDRAKRKLEKAKRERAKAKAAGDKEREIAIRSQIGKWTQTIHRLQRIQGSAR